VADTEQHGICTALRLPDGTWAGLQNDGHAGGTMPGRRPTRQQLSGGALVLNGFDFEDSAAIANDGQRWVIAYGVVSAPRQAARVRDTVSAASVPVIDGRYFAIAFRPVANDSDDNHLEAVDASGQTVAQEGRALAQQRKSTASSR